MQILKRFFRSVRSGKSDGRQLRFGADKIRLPAAGPGIALPSQRRGPQALGHENLRAILRKNR